MTKTLKDPAAKAARHERKAAATLAVWKAWKDEASPALRRHAEAVEGCTICAIPPSHVAGNFMGATVRKPYITKQAKQRYHEIKERRPDRGPAAARFAAEFRAEHGHGPSGKQICTALGWGDQPTLVRNYILYRLLKNGWLTNTAPVPWTLRPGPAQLPAQLAVSN